MTVLDDVSKVVQQIVLLQRDYFQSLWNYINDNARTSRCRLSCYYKEQAMTTSTSFNYIY